MTMTDTPITTWTTVCHVDQLAPERGVAALIDGSQVAIFRVDTDGTCDLYAIDNFDPISQANVLARGIVGTDDDVLYVASPLKKERYALATGECLSAPGVSVRTWPVQVTDGQVAICF